MVRSSQDKPLGMHEKTTASSTAVGNKPVKRIKSEDLLEQMREIEIDHEGRIYRLRLTQLKKLILTA